MKKGLYILLVMVLLCYSIIARAEEPKAFPSDIEGWSLAIAALTPEQLLMLRSVIDARLKELDAFPYIELGKGSEGNDVTALQERLKALYYYKSDLTGKFDAETIKAFKAFEKQNGLKSNGVASIDEQDMLYSNTALANPTPTPSPAPTPTPTPIPREKAFYLTSATLYEAYSSNRVKIAAKNDSKNMTIDTFDVTIKAYNRYGELLNDYGYGADEAKITEDLCSVKPGKKYSSGGTYWYLFGFDTATKIEAAVSRYHTTKGETIDIPEEDMIWVTAER